MKILVWTEQNDSLYASLLHPSDVEPVKRRPPTARRFYSRNFTVPLDLYIRRIPHVANALLVAGYS